jgi:pimeloyl-ACP methyl ester carboxylesterase
VSRQVAILHGWSDSSDSFRPLAKFLKDHGYKAVPIFLGDYISLRDDVNIDDVAKRMEEVVRAKMARPKKARDHLGKEFDLIVHSTGGLVARRWIATNYANRPCPVKNLLMLAPANFGSKLAHIGRSMMGRIAKGWRTGFETGEEMLYALELGSRFQWELAESDLLVEPGSSAGATQFYGPDHVRPFVIVGTHPYPGLAEKLTNENGGDGTVRVAAANLNTLGITIDFSGVPEHLLSPKLSQWEKRGGEGNEFPLAVLPDRTHGSIISPDEPGLGSKQDTHDRLGQLVVQALSVNTAAQYSRVKDDWKAVTAAIRELAGFSEAAQTNRDGFFEKSGTPAEYFHEYYQVNVRVEDEFGEPIPDYFLSFMPKQKQRWYSLKKAFSPEGMYFHEEVLEDVHKYQLDNSRRSLFIDRFDLMREGGYYSRLKGADSEKELNVTVSAADPGDRIAYFTRKASLKRGLIKIHQMLHPDERWLKRHRTHMVKVIVPRAADPKIFTLNRG